MGGRGDVGGPGADGRVHQDARRWLSVEDCMSRDQSESRVLKQKIWQAGHRITQWHQKKSWLFAKSTRGDVLTLAEFLGVDYRLLGGGGCGGGEPSNKTQKKTRLHNP